MSRNRRGEGARGEGATSRLVNMISLIPKRFLSHGLIRGIVVLLQIGMGQGILHQDPLVGVEGEHPLQEIKGLAVRVGVEFGPGDLWFVRQRLDVAPSLLVNDTVEILLTRRAQDCKDVVQLVQVVFPGEDRSVGEHLG